MYCIRGGGESEAWGLMMGVGWQKVYQEKGSFENFSILEVILGD